MMKHEEVCRQLTEPRKVDADLLAKVGTDVVKGLVLVPHAPARPVLIQHLASVQLVWLHVVIVGFLMRALKPQKHRITVSNMAQCKPSDSFPTFSYDDVSNILQC